jgi:hypothetical protein
MQPPMAELSAQQDSDFSELGSLLELLQEPALLLDSSEVLCGNRRFFSAFPNSGGTLSRVGRELTQIVRDKTPPLITNQLMVDEAGSEVICAVTLTPLRNSKKPSFVSATFRNICELDSHTLANVLQQERFQSCALPHIAYGISELDIGGLTTTWIYLSPAACELLAAPTGPGLSLLLRESARKWGESAFRSSRWPRCR